jgi:tRNA A-37 threonylcarbamoyl transferase component Bud32
VNILDELRRDPRFLQRFDIGECVGAGTTGEVYRAFDTYRERDVALKVAPHAPAPGADPRHRRLWANEARLAGKLRHPYVVEVYEAAELANCSYLVMEYVEGGTLKDHTQPDRLMPIERVVDVTFKVARALEYANTMGLLHRDVKPANVLLTKDGSPKVSDFGAAYFTGAEDTQVSDVGTLPFVPPEQLSGAHPSVQGDIYATGVMAYLLLCGAYPFPMDSQASLMFHKLHGEPVPLGARRPELPEPLRLAVERAMHQDPALRYPSWAALCKDLAILMPGLNAESEIATESAQFELLKATSFFAGFTETQLWEAVRLFRAHRVPPGTTVFEEGAPGRSLFVLTSGELAVISKGVTLGVVPAGDCFGELAFLQEEGHVRSASVVAMRASTFVEFDAEALQFASANLQAPLLREIMRTLVRRVRRSDQRFLDAMLGRAPRP